MPPFSLTLAARYILPVEGPPLRDGAIDIRDGRILALGPAKGRTVEFDLDNAAIIPGLVNAHTHLELPPLEMPAGSSPENQIDWLRRVIELRRDTADEVYRKNIATNLKQAIDSGTTLLADITTAGKSWDSIVAAPIRAVVFAEVLGIRRERGLQTNQQAWDWISSLGPLELLSERAQPGISPHAPYSTSGWLYERSASSGLPLSTHLAELPEEIRLLSLGDGPLRDLLRDIGAWDDDWEPIGATPADYIRRGDLRQADWLIAHGTYIHPEDFWQLRPSASPEDQRVAVAFCPRTHARFGHQPHPFREMLERGIIVCIGTDSRASCSSLSVLDEIRFLHRHDLSLPPQLLLTMATLFGAWALRREHITGSLKPGKSADLAVIPLPDEDDGDDPYRLVLQSDAPSVATFFEGNVVSAW